MRTALVHDYLTQRGGAERVVLSMSRALPDAPLYTSLYDPDETFSEFADRDVRTTRLSEWALLRRKHRLALPLLAPAFSGLEVEADVVLCSSSGWAHGVRAAGRKIVYCHSPAKWLHDPERYFASHWSVSRVGLTAMRRPLTRWDLRAAGSADRYLVNSTMVRDWVWRTYRIEADVLPPPHGVDADGPRQEVPGLQPGFLLCVSRLMAYKNVDAVVEAARSLPGQQVVVVGSGPLEAALHRDLPRNVVLLSRVSDAELRWLYGCSAGLVTAAHEDFGLTPLEANAFGRPVAALRWGGFLDTVVDDETGVLFDDTDPATVAAAMRRLVGSSWSERALVRHSERYSEERFAQRLLEVLGQEAQLAA